MKKVLIISATSYTNLDLSKNIKSILDELNINSQIINLENYDFPLFAASTFKQEKGSKEIKEITDQFVESSGLIFCVPEYNGSIPPIVTNLIAWISVSTEYWKDGFKDKTCFIASSSEGDAAKFHIAMKNQLEHLGSVVIPESISVYSSNPYNSKSTRKILKYFVKLL